MTVKETLKNCLLLYPAIFPNKWAVYEQWFIVNGNGYTWYRGELVSREDEKIVDLELAVKKHFQFYLSDDNLLQHSKFGVEKCLESCIASINWEKRSQDFTYPRKKEKTIYPLCNYAKILNIPNNIKPDWLEAAKEMYKWLQDNPQHTTDADKEFLSTIKWS